jgi:probable F420-dependent oxidoreductase
MTGAAKEKCMKFWLGVSFVDTEQLVPIARKAEELGYHGIAFSDHVFFPQKLGSHYPYSKDGQLFWKPETHWPDVWVAIAAMAAVTTRLRFTTSVYILPLRNVFVVAKAVATAAVISNNRVELGAGVGWMKDEFDQLGQDHHRRGRHTDEMIEVLRKLWYGGMVEHHGAFYDFPPLQMSPAPSAPIPIWLSGDAEPAIRRAARLADGWISSPKSQDALEATIEKLRRLRREFGRENEPFQIRAQLGGPPTPDRIRWAEDLGINHTGASPWTTIYSGADTPSLEAKLEGMERWADQYLKG